jgi:transketolase
MVYEALIAADRLSGLGISVRVVNVSTLKPLDEESIIRLSEDVKGIITVEEHSIIGGLASAVTYALRGKGIPIKTIGINDEFGQSANTYDELLVHYGLTADNIVENAKALY